MPGGILKPGGPHRARGHLRAASGGQQCYRTFHSEKEVWALWGWHCASMATQWLGQWRQAIRVMFSLQQCPSTTTAGTKCHHRWIAFNFFFSVYIFIAARWHAAQAFPDSTLIKSCFRTAVLPAKRWIQIPCPTKSTATPPICSLPSQSSQ